MVSKLNGFGRVEYSQWIHMKNGTTTTKQNWNYNAHNKTKNSGHEITEQCELKRDGDANAYMKNKLFHEM